ncbi:hypothetical protein BDV96DRAFT_649510 [Lophiotrema nucula]|uniref:Uncharacterized protein n=1 Tax=Lophiotrema nucula TaxID=690887 RepID=A0A6A5Z1D9_9PLEO|nr:hypothetical protein BDV96DRAFT_649510 [Lophiotrema nucula]
MTFRWQYGQTDSSFRNVYGRKNWFQIEISTGKYGYTPHWPVAWEILCKYRSDCCLVDVQSYDWAALRTMFTRIQDADPDNYMVFNGDGTRINLDTQLHENMLQRCSSMYLFRKLQELTAAQPNLTPSPEINQRPFGDAEPVRPISSEPSS